MVVRAGNLDRLITIQQPEKTKGEDGEVTITGWANFAENIRASKRDTRGTEFHLARQVKGEITTTWRIRWRAGVTSEMRLQYGNEYYEIVAPIEVGRKEGLDLYTRRLDT